MISVSAAAQLLFIFVFLLVQKVQLLHLSQREPLVLFVFIQLVYAADKIDHADRERISWLTATWNSCNLKLTPA